MEHRTWKPCKRPAKPSKVASRRIYPWFLEGGRYRYFWFTKDGQSFVRVWNPAPALPEELEVEEDEEYDPRVYSDDDGNYWVEYELDEDGEYHIVPAVLGPDEPTFMSIQPHKSCWYEVGA